MANNTNSCSSSTVATRPEAQQIKFRYKWQIYNPHLLNGRNYSPIFTAQYYESYQWKIRLDFISGHIFLYLHFVGTNQHVKVNFRFRITHGVLELRPVYYASRCEGKLVNFTPTEEIFFGSFPWSTNYINESVYPNIDLIIDCEVCALIENGNCGMLKNLQNELIQKLESLLDSDKFSDVKFVVGDHELSAHRAILAVRSEVFAAMFKHEMEESKSGRIIITDFKPEVIKEMLHFMYTTKTPNLAQMAGDLLVAADKYALQDLKDMCEVSLYRQLSSETAIQTLILADLYRLDKLKSKTIAFICINAAKIMNTQAWKTMITGYPHLVATELSELIISNSLMWKN